MGRETELCNRLGRTPEERLLLRRVLDQSMGAVRKCEPCRTPFLTPRECALAKQLIAALGIPLTALRAVIQKRNGKCAYSCQTGLNQRMRFRSLMDWLPCEPSGTKEIPWGIGIFWAH